jgi:hypothetical protein
MRKMLEALIAIFILFPLAYTAKLYNMYHDHLFERKARIKKRL